MAKKTDIPGGVIGLLLVAIAFLVTMLANLFAPSVPTASTVKNTVIPLENASVSAPGDIQGSAAGNPQNAATLTPAQLHNL